MEDVQVRVRGRVDMEWSDWLCGLSIEHTGTDETLVSGVVRDQAALRGLIDRVADLGIELSSLVSRKVDVPRRWEGFED